MPLNDQRSDRIDVDCICRGRMASCHRCYGSGKVTKKACVDCGGTGAVAPGSEDKCRSCRGNGVSPFADGVDGTRDVIV